MHTILILMSLYSDVAWKDMDHDQKTKFMKEEVMPKAKVFFKEFDAKHFEKVTCATCHGKDGKERKHKMPSNDLRTLPGTPEAFKKALEKEKDWPKWTKFMKETVTVQMAQLLGMPTWDPKKPDAPAFG